MSICFEGVWSRIEALAFGNSFEIFQSNHLPLLQEMRIINLILFLIPLSDYPVVLCCVTLELE